MVEQARVRRLNDTEVSPNEYVLYWMQSSQRVPNNHALSYAIEQANKINLPLRVASGLTEYPEANLRHYSFMLEGLQEVQKDLLELGAGIYFDSVHPVELVSKLAKAASILVLDRGYLRTEKGWYLDLLGKVKCPVIQVESNVVVPVETASQKEEYAARTIRGKINKNVERFLKPVTMPELENNFKGENKQLSRKNLEKLDINMEPGDSSYTGGYSEAQRLLDDFISNKLDGYHDLKNDPVLDHVSNMSPYLHFGQISPLEIALKVKESGSKGVDAFLEELIVRRELAINFVHYNPSYDSIKCLPSWCMKTLDEHRNDPREYNYSMDELENSRTHDQYWNASQSQMVKTGKMHGYMRMYWGKKIIEWTESPEKAYTVVIHLNNKYELDGRDPNGFTGVAWCFGKHDRPWKERAIFGKIRFMNDKGLERKFKIRQYADIWTS